MCGIVGYVGDRPALDVVMGGLRRLEYRGYDSAGVAILDPTGPGLRVVRRAGKLRNLDEALAEEQPPLAGNLGIGHTRWATHGAPTDANAHPHVDCSGTVAVVHNGTIENYTQLRDEVEDRGHRLTSETDTEAIAHLIEEAYVGSAAAAGGPHHPRRGDLAAAVREVCNRLEGSFVLVVAHRDHPDTVVGARRNLPLVVGLGDGENFLASDVTAFMAHSRTARTIAQDQIVEIHRGRIAVTGFDGSPIDPEEGVFRIDWDVAMAEKGGFDSFMRKEIAEQAEAIDETLGGRIDASGRVVLDELAISDEDIRDLDEVFIVACGSAYHSGLVGKYAIERWCRLPVQVEMASEFRYRDPVVGRKTLVVAVSQSGETADTLEAVRHARSQNAWVLAVTNTVGSSIARESDAAFYTRGGPEIAVASTKCVMTQLTAMYLVGLYLAQVRGTRDGDEVASHFNDLRHSADLVAEVLQRMDPVRKLARDLSEHERVLFLGRHVGYPMALEGALKLKELAYISAEGFAAGEIKHGPIALVEQGTPVVVLAPRHALTPKLITNVQEVRARGALTIVISTDGVPEIDKHAEHLIRIPNQKSLLSPLLMLVPMQVFAAEFALARGLDIDQPRNLAKSVTVE